MTTERWLRLIAGTLIMLSVALGTWITPWWYAFTAFIGLNLFQSGFTDWCPMMWILEKLGTTSVSSPPTVKRMPPPSGIS